ncbi:MAG: hypothetical protein OXE99_12910 [Cellvibrionales bacterium]|nr:hypothetical protein [Cellvibrionales bacterium]
MTLLLPQYTSHPQRLQILPIITILSILWLAGCSNYKTNANLSFAERYPRAEPQIHIGEVDVGNEELDYLGWVDAKVSKPHVLATAPTKAQVNLVLEELAKPLGADAVTFVTYKTGLAGQTIEARGQAVRFKNPVTRSRYAKMKQPSINHLQTQPAYQPPYAQASTSYSQTSVTQSQAVAPIVQPSDKALSVSPSALNTQAPTQSTTPIVSASVSPPLTPSKVKTLDDEALALIISNAIYVIEQSKTLNRKDLQLSAQTIKTLAEQAKTAKY